MFYDYDCISLIYKLSEHFKQHLDIVEMKSGSRLVEDV